MGELEGIKNAWGYPEGGTGAVSMAIARAAKSHGAVINTDCVSMSLTRVHLKCFACSPTSLIVSSFEFLTLNVRRVILKSSVH